MINYKSLCLINMKFRASTFWGFLSSAYLFLVFVAIMMINLSSQYASAAGNFQNETDRLALLEFKHHLSDDPYGVFNSWNDSLYHCRWLGVTCDTRHQRVISLTLSGKNLFGPISPHIANLSFMKSIYLEDNRFFGEIPQEIGHLFRLRTLNLTMNSLSGEIPVNLSRCSELRSLSVQSSGIIGKIPTELGSLRKLVYLNLGHNNLTGQIPRSIGNLSSLSFLSLRHNNLEDNLPNEMGFLISLFVFSVSGNKLTGEIPPSFYNNSFLTLISLLENFFHGNLPADIGLKLPNLQGLATGENQFSGNIPISFVNASKLGILDLSHNNFGGKVPSNLGNLLNLQRLNLAGNLLGQNSADDLLFVPSLTNCSSLRILGLNTNNFGGELPKSIGNLSVHLQSLAIGSNKIFGTIPVGLGRYSHLYALGLEENLLSGIIPSDFGEFQNLQGLYLAENKFSGQIPSTLCNVTSLYDLDLGGNNFEGSIPPTFGHCQNLRKINISRNKLTGVISPKIFGSSFSPVVLDLSHNFLVGSLPLEEGKLTGIIVFNVSHNIFLGEIPKTLGECSSLEYLHLQGNFFNGTIPSNLGSLKGILHLDLSRNNLTGEIPRELGRLTVLIYLNLSFNDLEGEIPIDGVFGNASLTILAGNKKLCGGISELHFHPCPVHRKKNGKPLVTIVTLSITFSVILICISLFFYYQKVYGREVSSTKALEVDKFLRISYHELHRATVGFSSENLIGSGSFGFVYKGRLDQHGDRLVAVKVLDLQKIGASKSFKAEVKALRNIRHRNLVSVLTYCSSVDSEGHEFMALVYEFMENGSLDMWLHPETARRKGSRNLNLLQRVNIAIDVASAMHYLHNNCEVIIVHCDLKPSNILLDNDLIAHVSDFGLARLLPKTTKSSLEQGTNSSIAIKGSIGYAAPEYGIGSKASTQGDVYSYGIFLLEILSGRRPTDDIFANGLDLHKYVRMNLLEGQIMKIIDPFLFPTEKEENTQAETSEYDGIELEEINKSMGNLYAGIENVQKSVASMFKIGLKCSAVSPNDRTDMGEVIRQLQLIRDAFLASDTKSAVHHRK